MPRITGMVLASCLLLVIATQIGIVQASGESLGESPLGVWYEGRCSMYQFACAPLVWLHMCFLCMLLW